MWANRPIRAAARCVCVRFTPWTEEPREKGKHVLEGHLFIVPRRYAQRSMFLPHTVPLARSLWKIRPEITLTLVTPP